MSIKSIQKPVGQLKILVYLYRNERASAKNIIYELGLNPGTATLALQNLEDLKLIRKLKNDIYKLTKKGKDVAGHLDKVEKLLSKPTRKSNN